MNRGDEQSELQNNIKMSCLIIFDGINDSNRIILLQLIINKMPFLFRFEVRDSQIEGKGLFALEDVPKDATFWVFETEKGVPVAGYDVTRPNQARNRKEMEQLSHEELADILLGGYYLDKSELFVAFNDGTQFTNHSDDPNSEAVEAQDYHNIVIKAIKPIRAGDEIFESYFHNIPPLSDWIMNLMKEHCPDRFNFELKLRAQAQQKQ